jgi:Biotin-lipoyl like
VRATISAFAAWIMSEATAAGLWLVRLLRRGLAALGAASSASASVPASTEPLTTSADALVSKQPNPLRPDTEDREFLPAALEILQTPPSPIATSLLLLICCAFSFAIAWSYFGWIDVYAVAPGKIQYSERSKVVQPLDSGKVVAIHVENGGRVNAGDLLLDLDPTETSTDREAQSRDLEATNAEIARRKIAISVARTESLLAQPVEFASGTNEMVRALEESVLLADIAQLASLKASLKAQLASWPRSATSAIICISYCCMASMTSAREPASFAFASSRISTRSFANAMSFILAAMLCPRRDSVARFSNQLSARSMRL